MTLDDPLVRQLAKDDPNGFLDAYDSRRVILDEVQQLPELLGHLKVRIDRHRGNDDEAGRYVLSGSQQFTLMPGVAETLAGRVALLELLPFSELTRLPTPEAALASPLGGPLFEGLVVAEVLKQQAHRGERPAAWFWRTRDGHEVDMLVPLAGRLLPIEVKLTATPTSRHAATLSRFRALAGDACLDHGGVVCRVPAPVRLPGGHIAMNIEDFAEWLDERMSSPG